MKKDYEENCNKEEKLKRCSKCGELMPLSNFHNSSSHIDGKFPWCKACKKIYLKAYRKEKAEEIKEKHREYRKKNFKKLSERKKAYDKIYRQKNKIRLRIRKRLEARILREKHPEKYREKRRKYLPRRAELHKVRYQNDSHYKLNTLISRSVRTYLKKKTHKNNPVIWREYFDFSVSDLEKHLKSTLKPGMTWQDFLDGNLHIDHIVPKSFFEFESVDDIEFKRCWALENLQLLWAEDNLIKGRKVNKKHYQYLCELYPDEM